MKRSIILSFILVLLANLFVASVSADEPLSPEALEIANNIHCPVCEGQSIRDSNAQLARDMRALVQQKLNEGYTEQEVYDYFTDRYGVGILRDPPKSGFFLTLWWAPVIGVALGVLVLGTFVVQRRNSVAIQSPASRPQARDTESSDMDRDLDRYEQELMQELDEDEFRGRE